MKTKLTTAALAVASVGLLAGSASAQTSPVVGFETVTLQPGQFNLFAPRLHGNPQTNGTFDGQTADTLTDSGNNFDALVDTSPYIVELADGTNFTITGADAAGDTITLTGAFDASDLQDYVIRDANTLDSILGNPTILAGSADGSQTGADIVWVPDGLAFKKFMYITAAGAEGWYDADAPATPLGATTVLTPGSAIYIETLGSTAGTTDIVVSGDLKTYPTAYAVIQEWNLIGSEYPAGETLDASKLSDYVAGSADGSQAGADILWVPDGLAFKKFMYITAAGAEGWYDADAPGTPLGDTEELSPGFYIQDADGTGGGVISPPDFYLTNNL